MKLSLSLLGTVVYGLVIRLLYGSLSSILEIMSLSFLFLVPALIGFITIILIPYEKIRSRSRAFFLPWYPCIGLLILTIYFEIEGTICWLMIFPIYSSLAGLGGIIAYSIKRSRKEKDQSPNKLQISLLALLPICLGFAEGDRTSVSRECVIACELVIDATPQEVWHQLTHIDSIKANEHHGGVTGLLGFPTHQSTRLDNVAVGGSRVATFEKGLVFYEKVTQCIPEKQLALSIKTLPDQIAADVLDEHIVIGGKHLNMLGDVYELQSMPGGKCKITLSSRFVICTPFNWYASIWAHWLMNDVLQSELSLIAQRCAEQKKDS